MNKLLLLVLITFNLVFANDFNSIEIEEGDVVIQAIGYGKTPDESKKDALSTLIHSIKSKVESNINIVQHVKNDKLLEDVKSEIKMQSKSYFEGLHYSQPELDKGYYNSRVIVTKEALLKTIKNLFAEVNQELKTMNQKQKNSVLEKINILRALLPYSKDITVLGKVTNKKLSDRKYLINRSLNMAEIIFKINLQDVSIEIKDKVYKENELIYLEPGNYRYTIKSKGYFDEKGSLYASAGISKTVEKRLIKKSETDIQIYVKTDNKFAISKDIATVLSKYFVGISNRSISSNALRYKFTQEYLMTIGTTKFYSLSLSVEAYKGERIYKIKKASLKRVSQTNLSSKASALASALTKAILKDIDMKKFKYDESIDYNLYLDK